MKIHLGSTSKGTLRLYTRHPIHILSLHVDFIQPKHLENKTLNRNQSVHSNPTAGLEPQRLDGLLLERVEEV